MQSKLGSGPLIFGIVVGAVILGIGFWSEIGIVTMAGMALLALTTVLGLALPPQDPAPTGSKLPSLPLPQISFEDLRSIAVPSGGFTASAVILGLGFWLELGVLTIVGMLLVALSIVLGLQGPQKTGSDT